MAFPIKVRRRDLMRFGIVLTAAATSTAVIRNVPAAEPTSNADKRKARYQADSVEVKNFYRVNRYPAR